MIEFPIKLAVASKEGLAISEHFGHAKQFRIYEAAPDCCRLLETREVAHYCLGRHSDQTAMTGILETIKDCHAVFVAKIGDGPTEKLKAIGVQAVSRYAYESIEDSLLDYVQGAAAGEESRMTKDRVAGWVLAHPLVPIHVDCAIAVMLKILDGKCKMRAAEKRVMELLYDEVKTQPGCLLNAALHPLIAQAREHPDDAVKNIIYEKRLLAETAISRPVMKGFKAMIRQEGLLDPALDEDGEGLNTP